MSSSGDRDYNLFSVTERERPRAIEWVRSDVQWGERERQMTSVMVCTTVESRRRHRRLQVAAVAALVVGIEFVKFISKHCICQLAALPLSRFAVSGRLL